MRVEKELLCLSVKARRSINQGTWLNETNSYETEFEDNLWMDLDEPLVAGRVYKVNIHIDEVN